MSRRLAAAGGVPHDDIEAQLLAAGELGQKVIYDELVCPVVLGTAVCAGPRFDLGTGTLLGVDVAR